MSDVGRHREGSAERRVVGRDHRRQIEAARLVARHWCADDPAAVPDDEGHHLGRAMRRGTDEIALILPIVVVGDDHDPTLRHRLDSFDHGLMMRHDGSPIRGGIEEVIGRNGAISGAQDRLGGIARHPGAGAVADLRDGARCQPDSTGEVTALDRVGAQPITQFHVPRLTGYRILAKLNLPSVFNAAQFAAMANVATVAHVTCADQWSRKEIEHDVTSVAIQSPTVLSRSRRKRQTWCGPAQVLPETEALSMHRA